MSTSIRKDEWSFKVTHIELLPYYFTNPTGANKLLLLFCFHGEIVLSITVLQTTFTGCWSCCGHILEASGPLIPNGFKDYFWNITKMPPDHSNLHTRWPKKIVFLCICFLQKKNLIFFLVFEWPAVESKRQICLPDSVFFFLNCQCTSRVSPTAVLFSSCLCHQNFTFTLSLSVF